MHLQKPAKKNFKYKKGNFKISERVSKNIISLPVHEFVNKKDLDYMIKHINIFYKT